MNSPRNHWDALGYTAVANVANDPWHVSAVYTGDTAQAKELAMPGAARHGLERLNRAWKRLKWGDFMRVTLWQTKTAVENHLFFYSTIIGHFQ